MDSEVVNLGYMVLTSEDPTAWAQFGESVLGLMVASQPASRPAVETTYLRMDDRSWRIGVQRGPDGGVAALGFDVADVSNFERLKGRLVSAGVAVTAVPELAAHRRVLDVFTVTDPAGMPLEFFYGLQTDMGPFVSPRGAKFITGTQGFGHAVLMGGDAMDLYKFYVDVLGFRLSDVIKIGPIAGYFTSPSPRHHTIAFASGVPDAPSGVQHIMLQVDDLDTIGRALDRVYDAGIPLVMGLGKHTNDHMISFYCSSPSGLTIEYGWAGREIDNATHTTGYYDEASFWGHRLVDGTNPRKAMREAPGADA